MTDKFKPVAPPQGRDKSATSSRYGASAARAIGASPHRIAVALQESIGDREDLLDVVLSLQRHPTCNPTEQP